MAISLEDQEIRAAKTPIRLKKERCGTFTQDCRVWSLSLDKMPRSPFDHRPTNSGGRHLRSRILLRPLDTLSDRVGWVFSTA